MGRVVVCKYIYSKICSSSVLFIEILIFIVFLNLDSSCFVKESGIVVSILIEEIRQGDFEGLKDDLISVVAKSVNVGKDHVTLSQIIPHLSPLAPIIMATVQTGKENHERILEEMSGSKRKRIGRKEYRDLLYSQIKENQVLKDIVKTAPKVGEPRVVEIPGKFVISLIIYADVNFHFAHKSIIYF